MSSIFNSRALPLIAALLIGGVASGDCDQGERLITAIKSWKAMSGLHALMEAEEERQAFAGVVRVQREGEVLHTEAYGLASRELDLLNKVEGVFLTGSPLGGARFERVRPLIAQAIFQSDQPD